LFQVYVIQAGVQFTIDNGQLTIVFCLRSVFGQEMGNKNGLYTIN